MRERYRVEQNQVKAKARKNLLLQRTQASLDHRTIGFMSDDELKAVLDIHLDKPREELDGQTTRQLLDDQESTFYVGITKQRLIDEALEFMKRDSICRGYEDCRYVPCITYADGSRLRSRFEAKTIAGLKYFALWTNISMYNVSRMEGMLQKMYQHLKRGERRLWWYAGAGDDYMGVYGTENQPGILYITYSYDIQGGLEEGTLIKGDVLLTRAHDAKHGPNSAQPIKRGFWHG
jgi:hypothetical protein